MSYCPWNRKESNTTEQITHTHTHRKQNQNTVGRPTVGSCCSVTKLCLTLWDPVDCSTPASCVLLCLWSLLKFMSTDAIQTSYPLLPSCPFAFNLSQHQCLFQRVSSLHQVAKVLEIQLQHQSFQWIFRVDFLLDWLVWSPCCPRESQASSPVQFESINSLALLLLVLSLNFPGGMTSFILQILKWRVRNMD